MDACSSRRWLTTSLVALACPLVAPAAPAAAAIYEVRQDGTGDFTSIQACATAAVAGDTCLVHPGVYDEVVTPASSGVPGSPIIFLAAVRALDSGPAPGHGTPPVSAAVEGFRLAGRTSIRIEGFEITDLPASSANSGVYLSGAHGSSVVANWIHHTAGIGIWLHHGTPSTGVVLRNNRIAFAGCTPGNCVGNGAIVSSGSDLLIEGNDVSHVGDFTNTWGSRIVLRNNLFHDVYNEDFPEYFDLPSHDPLGHHVDAVQHFATGNPLHYLLFEENVVRDVPLANVHGGIFQDQDGDVSDSDAVYRHNIFHDLGGAMMILNPFREFRAVGNTTARINLYASRGSIAFGATETVGPSSYVKLFNNLFHDSTRDVPWAQPYATDAGSRVGFEADRNLANLSGTPVPLEANGIVGLDPLFSDPAARDFTLTAGSPAVDAGGALTRVAATDSGAGTVLEVVDARYFQDGWAGVSPDWIAFGDAPATAEVAQVVAIDYAAGRITLDRAAPRSPGQPVWLQRGTSGRSRLLGAAPDIGAEERVPGVGAVARLLAVEAGAANDDVDLSWDAAAGTAGYNVWYVIDRRNLPLARRWREPHATGVLGCSPPVGVPPGRTTCTDSGAIGRGPALLLYQVRGHVNQAVEGP